MDKYIGNVQLADAIHQACEDYVRHAASALGYSGPLVQTSTALNAVSALEASASLVWWYPAVKSSRVNTVGFKVPMRDKVCCMFEWANLLTR